MNNCGEFFPQAWKIFNLNKIFLSTAKSYHNFTLYTLHFPLFTSGGFHVPI